MAFQQQNQTKNNFQKKREKKKTNSKYTSTYTYYETLIILVERRPVCLYNILPNNVCRMSTAKKAASITVLM